MNVERIGTWAGLVWNALSNANTAGVKQLKKATKLKDKEIFAAIGWLARENKITLQPCEDDDKEIIITLI